MRAFNVVARRTRKRLLSSDYDPIAMRAALAQPSSLAAPSATISLMHGSIELRGDQTLGKMLFYIAGGGFCFGAGDAHRSLADIIGGKIGARRAILHHRLAPEAPFPAAYEDSVEALRWALQAMPARQIVVAADSSGAALMIAALMTLRDENSALPARAVFLSPLTDVAMTGRSHVSNARHDPMFGPEAVIHKGYHYLHGANPTDPRISPLWGELAGLPPMLILAGSTEVMLDDARRLASKVSDAGGHAELCVVRQAPHVFPLIEHFPESRVAREKIVAFLEQA